MKVVNLKDIDVTITNHGVLKGCIKPKMDIDVTITKA
jgi:hypothetical protein